MTRFDVAVLSFRILALYFLFLAVWSGISILGMLIGGGSDRIPELYILVLLAMYAALGAALFKIAPAIGRSLFRGDEPMSTANRPEIGALALKVCGVLLFADCLSRSSQLLETYRSFAGGLMSTLLLGACAALLFFAAPSLSRRLFGAPVKPLAAPLLAHVQAVTFSVLGIWLLVSALAVLAESMGDGIRFGAWGRDNWGQVAKAALGMVLFLGGAGLSAFWYWIRHAGLNPRPQTPP